MESTSVDHMPLHERMQFIKDTADSTEETTYYKPLTPDELEQKREEYLENQFNLQNIEDDLKAT